MYIPAVYIERLKDINTAQSSGVHKMIFVINDRKRAVQIDIQICSIVQPRNSSIFPYFCFFRFSLASGFHNSSVFPSYRVFTSDNNQPSVHSLLG